MKFAVTVTLKKDVLDPQGKVVGQTLKNMGIKNIAILIFLVKFRLIVSGNVAWSLLLLNQFDIDLSYSAIMLKAFAAKDFLYSKSTPSFELNFSINKS